MELVKDFMVGEEDTPEYMVKGGSAQHVELVKDFMVGEEDTPSIW